MKVLFVSLLMVASPAFAQKPPPPPTDPKAAPADARIVDEPGGAIKREEKTVIPPEHLTEPTPGPAPAVPAGPDESRSFFGTHLFGVHAALGLPHPFNFGVNYVVPNRLFSFEVATGAFGMTQSDVELSIQNTQVGLRYHPFAGSFFVGALLGNQSLTGKKSERITDTGSGISYDVQAEVEVKSNYVTPQVGWMWGGQASGFFASVELGFQSPSSVDTKFTSNAPAQVQNEAEYVDLKRDVEDGGDKLGNQVLPSLTLLKIGWLF